jgi:hypothetical protein
MASLWVSKLPPRAREGWRATATRFIELFGWLLAGMVTLPSLACSIDSRTLYTADDPRLAQDGDPSSSGGRGSGSGGGAIRPPDAVSLPDCSYSGATKPGCETLVDNAGFGSDVEGWEAEPLAIAVAWSPRDAEGSNDSGSIAVLNTMHGKNEGVAPGGGRQCLPAIPGAIYDMAGDVFIPSGQGEGYMTDGLVGSAGLSILFWPNDDCSLQAPSLKSFQTALVSEEDEWQRVEGAAIAPDLAASMSVRVLTVKPFLQFQFEAYFDNVLLQER